METDQIAGLVGQGGIASALIWVIMRVGLKLVAAIDGLRGEVAAHTKTDVAAMADVRRDLATLNARIETAIDLTPVRRASVTNNAEG